MPLARHQIINTSTTTYYHCMSRCVRKAFLCGYDASQKKSYEHRKAWFISRLEALSTIFSIEIYAFAIMCNHYHLVLNIDEISSKNWSDTEVARRWCRLYKGTHLVRRFLQNDNFNTFEQKALKATILLYRKRLTSISWFMRSINEYIARKANKEDDCKGRFWEGRFKSQALCDKKALLACMSYVDLNPIRAQVKQNPPHKNTSWHSRETKEYQFIKPLDNSELTTTKNYLQTLMDISKSLIDGNTNISKWFTACCHFEKNFKVFAGGKSTLEKIKEKLELKKLHGIRNAYLLTQ